MLMRKLLLPHKTLFFSFTLYSSGFHNHLWHDRDLFLEHIGINILGQVSREIILSSRMSSTKYDIEKFMSKNDFGLQRMKMRALLAQQGLEDALEGEKKLPTTLLDKRRRIFLIKPIVP